MAETVTFLSTPPPLSRPDRFAACADADDYSTTLDCKAMNWSDLFHDSGLSDCRCFRPRRYLLRRTREVLWPSRTALITVISLDMLSLTSRSTHSRSSSLHPDIDLFRNGTAGGEHMDMQKLHTGSATPDRVAQRRRRKTRTTQAIYNATVLSE